MRNPGETCSMRSGSEQQLRTTQRGSLAETYSTIETLMLASAECFSSVWLAPSSFVNCGTWSGLGRKALSKLEAAYHACIRKVGLHFVPGKSHTNLRIRAELDMADCRTIIRCARLSLIHKLIGLQCPWFAALVQCTCANAAGWGSLVAGDWDWLQLHSSSSLSPSPEERGLSTSMTLP